MSTVTANEDEASRTIKSTRLARPQDSIGLIGTPNSGKTIYIMSITEYPLASRSRRWTFGLGYPEALGWVQRQREGRPAATPRRKETYLPLFPAQTRLGAIFRRVPLLGSLFREYQVSVPDVTGEFVNEIGRADNFEAIRAQQDSQLKFELLSYLAECGGLLCCIDPLGWDPDTRRPNPDKAIAYAQRCQATIGYIKKQRGEKSPLPLSILLTKADSLQSEQKHIVELPKYTSLVASYFHGRPAPGWLHTVDAETVQFDVMEALRYQPGAPSRFAEAVAWDFVNCHLPEAMGDLFRGMNADEQLTARLFLVSSTGRPLPIDDEGGERYLGRDETKPVRTLDPIRSVLERMHAAHSQPRQLRFLVLLAAILMGICLVGPWMVNISAWASSRLIRDNQLQTADIVLSAMKHHPVLELDRWRAPRRLSGLADANMQLAEAMHAAGGSEAENGLSSDRFEKVLRAANRAVDMGSDPAHIARRDEMLAQQLQAELAAGRGGAAFQFLEQSRGLLRPTAAMLERIREVLTQQSEDVMREVIDERGTGDSAATQGVEALIERLSRFASSLVDRTAFVDPNDRALEGLSDSIGYAQHARCEQARAQLSLASWNPPQAASALDLERAFFPLQLAVNAIELATKSGDPAVVREGSKIEFLIAKNMLDSVARNGLAPTTPYDPPNATIEAVAQVEHLVELCPALSEEARAVAERYLESARRHAADQIETAVFTPEKEAAWAGLNAAHAAVLRLVGGDPFEHRGVALLFELRAFLAGLSSETAYPSRPRAVRLAGLIREWDKSTPDVQVLQAGLPPWNISDEIARETPPLGDWVVASLERAVAAGIWPDILRAQQMCDALGERSPRCTAASDVALALVAAAEADATTRAAATAECERRFASAAANPTFGSMATLIEKVAAYGGQRLDAANILVLRAGLGRDAAADQRLAALARRLDEAMLTRLMGAARIPEGFPAALAEHIVQGPRAADALNWWLAACLQHDAVSKLGPLCDALCERYAANAIAPAPEAKIFGPYLAWFKDMAAGGKAGSASIDPLVSKAAERLGATRAMAALAAADRHQRLVQEHGLVFIPGTAGTSPVYFGAAEVTLDEHKAMLGKAAIPVGATEQRIATHARLLGGAGTTGQKAAFGVPRQEAIDAASVAGARLPTEKEWIGVFQLGKPVVKFRDPNASFILTKVELVSLGDVIRVGADEVSGMTIGVSEMVNSAIPDGVLGSSRVVLESTLPTFPVTVRPATRVDDNRLDVGYRLAADPVPDQVVTFVALFAKESR